MPFPPPPAVALISSGKPIFGAMSQQLVVGHVAHIFGARHDRHAGLDDRGAGHGLSPMAAMADGLGPMKAIPSSSQACGKVIAFGQEAIAGMDRVRAAFFSDFDDLIRPQIGFARRRRAEQVGLVCIADVQGLPVRFRIDGDGFEPSSRQARMMRTAISPRLATNTFLNMTPRLCHCEGSLRAISEGAIF
jgi:hypothetical protein